MSDTSSDSIGVGWRDRDWAKFNDDEWRALVGGPSEPFASTTSRGTEPFLPAPRQRKRSTGPAAAILITVVVVAFGATVGVDAFHKLTKTPAVAALTAPPANVVRIRWRDGDVLPSPSAGQICVNDLTAGKVCANYAAGEKPADALTRRLQTLGLTVESSGS